jgi:hypothetical protein
MILTPEEDRNTRRWGRERRRASAGEPDAPVPPTTAEREAELVRVAR